MPHPTITTIRKKITSTYLFKKVPILKTVKKDWGCSFLTQSEINVAFPTAPAEKGL